MKTRAQALGANAIVGVDTDYEVWDGRQYADGYRFRTAVVVK